MKRYYTIIVLIFAFFISCEDEEYIEPIDNNIYGSLICNIDSLKENFILDLNNTRIDTGISDGVRFITIEGMDLGSNTLRLQIPGRIVGNFKITYSMGSLSKYTTKQGVVYFVRDGEVNLTKVDFANKKLSGNFYLKLLRTGYQDTINVRNGLFVDLPLPKKK